MKITIVLIIILIIISSVWAASDPGQFGYAVAQYEWIQFPERYESLSMYLTILSIDRGYEVVTIYENDKGPVIVFKMPLQEIVPPTPTMESGA